MQSEKITNSKVQTPQTNCHFWGGRNKNSILGMMPAQSTTKGVGRPHKSPEQPKPWTCRPPSARLRNQPILLECQQGHLLLVFIPLCCSMNRNKALLEILIWPLLSFYWLKSPRTQIGNITMFTPILPGLGRSGGVEVWTRSNPVTMWTVIVGLFVCLPNQTVISLKAGAVS